MKVKLYMDVYKGQKEWFSACSNVSHDPTHGNTRFHFTVEIPDSALKAEQGQRAHVEDFEEAK